MVTVFPAGAQPHDITVLSNEFLDVYMPKANGEFVKIYLCFLRLLQKSAEKSVSASEIADRLSCTEKDVVRALRYWEETGLLTLSAQKAGETARPKNPETTAASVIEKAPTGQPENKVPAQPSRERFEELEKQAEIQELNFVAERYFQRTLSRKDLETIAFCYDSLHFSSEVIDYLLEYCADHGKTASRYVETVALGWHDSGIRSVEAARCLVESRQKTERQYFEILRALGITDRSPIQREKELMQRWLSELALPMDVIKEACTRTVLKTTKPTLAYAGKILSRWHEAGVKSLADVQRIDDERGQREAKAPQKPSRPRSAVGSFGNYEQRNSDYRNIEKIIYDQLSETG